MRAGAGRAVVFKLAPQAFPGPAGQGGIDVAERMPGRLVELDRAGDGIAEEQGSLRPGGEHHAQVAGGMARREHSGNTRGDCGVTVERPEPVRVRGVAPARPDVRAPAARSGPRYSGRATNVPSETASARRPPISTSFLSPPSGGLEPCPPRLRADPGAHHPSPPLPPGHWHQPRCALGDEHEFAARAIRGFPHIQHPVAMGDQA